MDDVMRSMAALKKTTTNMAPTLPTSATGKQTTPNTSRKRKSSDFDADKENQGSTHPITEAPKSKRAKSTTTKKQPAQQAAGEPATTAKSSSSSSSATSKPARKQDPKKPLSKKEEKEAELAKYDVSQIELPGEAEGMVPVYDTCNDIRTKINAHMRNAPATLSTGAGFIRAIRKCLPDHGHITAGMSPQSLKTFLKKSGPNVGATSPIFYAAYVYFEKLRIKQGKKPTKKREEMENVWGAKGMDLDFDGGQRLLVGPHESVVTDKYGKTDVVTRRRKSAD